MEDRVEHLRRLREVQDESRGFRAFVCWSYQSVAAARAATSHAQHTDGADYLMMLAVSRLYLDNFPHFQSSWVTQGLRVGQLALEFGCDDMGSIMIEENVVRAAGTAFRLDTERMVRAIEATGGGPCSATPSTAPSVAPSDPEPEPVAPDAGYLLFIWTPTESLRGARGSAAGRG